MGPEVYSTNDGLFAEQGAATISDGVIFDPLIDDVHDLSDGFRVFTDPQGQPNTRARPRLSLIITRTYPQRGSVAPV